MVEASILSFILIISFIFWRRQLFIRPYTSKPSADIFKAYEKVDSLFVNRSEQVFYNILRSRLPSGYYLMSKVRLEDIVCVKPTVKNEKRKWSLRGRIKSRHVDFLVIDSNGRPRLVVELDGASHKMNSQSISNADALKDGIFHAVKMPFIRVNTGDDFFVLSQSLVREFL